MDSRPFASLDRVLACLTDTELHTLLGKIQAELLDRPTGTDALVVEIVTAEEEALLTHYRRRHTPPTSLSGLPLGIHSAVLEAGERIQPRRGGETR